MSKGTRPQSGAIAKQAPPRELIPAGNYAARCYSVIVIGTVEEEYMGTVKKAEKVRIFWELPTEMITTKDGDEKPASMSKEFTMSTSPRANLRKVLDSWRGKPMTEKEASGFDLVNMLGAACMLNIVHKAGKPGTKNEGKFFEEVDAVTPLPKGADGKRMLIPEAINPERMFDFGPNFDQRFVESLPDFIKNKIKKSDEWRAKLTEGAIDASIQASPEEAAQHTDSALPSADDDLPF